MEDEFNTLLIKKVITMTRRNGLKWQLARKGRNRDNIFISEKVKIDVEVSAEAGATCMKTVKDSFCLERKQKLNPTIKDPYTYELSWGLFWMLSHECQNIALYEFAQWFFADDLTL